MKKAQAFGQLDTSARSMLVLERLPEVIRAFAPVASAVAAPMGDIDKLVMIDGGGGAGSSSSLQRLAGTVPQTLFGLVQTAQAMGLDLSGLLGKLGVEVREGAAPVDPAAAAAIPAAPREVEVKDHAASVVPVPDLTAPAEAVEHATGTVAAQATEVVAQATEVVAGVKDTAEAVGSAARAIEAAVEAIRKK